MIQTVTLNPSIDYSVEVKDFKLGSVNRTHREGVLPGGKGINVSVVLSHLNVPNEALGFIAGFTGDEIERMVSAQGVKSNFISVEQGLSRINIKLKSQEESEINGIGPAVTEAHMQSLYKQIDGLSSGDILVLAGSIPSTLALDTYQCIMKSVQGKGVKVVVDATKKLLINALPYKPFLIKPNHHELGELFDITLRTQNEVIKYAKKLQEQGAQNVLVSMAGDGAILVDETGKVYQHNGLKGEVKNSVGAGDSMVAGFIAGYSQNHDFEQAFKLGIAAGSASAFSTDLATKEEIERLLKKL